jgi:hypothetical protein
MPAPERAQRVRRRHALICEEFGLVPDEDSAADSVVIDHVRRVELGTLRESFHATTEEHEEKAAITPDEYPTATDKELSALHKSIDEADDPNEEKADITIAEDLIAADMTRTRRRPMSRPMGTQLRPTRSWALCKSPSMRQMPRTRKRPTSRLMRTPLRPT